MQLPPNCDSMAPVGLAVIDTPRSYVRSGERRLTGGKSHGRNGPPAKLIGECWSSWGVTWSIIEMIDPDKR